MATLTPSELYPAVRRFLVQSGLTRSLKSFNKETNFCEDEDAHTNGDARAAILASLELVRAGQFWLDAQPAPVEKQRRRKNAEQAGEEDAAVVVKSSKKKKRAEAEAEEAAAPAVALEEEAPKKKKKHSEEVEVELVKQEKVKKTKTIEEAEPEATPEAKPESTPEPKAESNAKEERKIKKEKKEKPEGRSGVPFSRVDQEKWTSAVKDPRLLDNTHTSKSKIGEVGDTWADTASADLLAVKGKGFRKEMAKKKRASWRGTGAMDMGVNSIPFPDSDED